MRDFREFLSIRQVACGVALVGMLQAPVYAQESVTLEQTLAPLPEEGPALFLSNLMGRNVATDEKTALVLEDLPTPPNGVEKKGRLAVFTRDSAGVWDRSGSIDEPA